MKKIQTRLAKMLAIAALAPLSLTVQAGDISSAELNATTCFMCHGAEGKAAGGAIPPLAGYPENVMAEQLLNFKSGKRPSTIMGRHMKAYSDDEIRAIAKYLGTLKP